jgi:predicted acyltransferase
VERIRSVDLLRGAVVLLMLFVNEVAGVAGAPTFLLHKGAEDDGMTITDAVFPAFLFVVGVAIPFALSGRLRRGEPRTRVLRHVLARSLALVAIGVLMVNGEHARPGPLPVAVWNVVMTLGVLLVWAAPAGGSPSARRAVPVAGWLLLLVAVLTFRGEGVEGVLQLRPYWWGILGLIGWAYLGVASLYLATGDRPAPLTALVSLYGCVALARAGGVAWPTIPGPITGGIVGTHGAVVMAGALFGVLLRLGGRSAEAPARVALRLAGCAAALAGAGLLLHTLAPLHRVFTISKIHATLPWGLLSAALTGGALALLLWLVDGRGWARWPRAVQVAGENPLLAYLLAPLLLSVFALVAPLLGGVNPYEELGRSTAIGLARSALFAWLVVWLTGVLRNRGWRFQL